MGVYKGIGRWKIKNKGLWVISRDGVWMVIPQTKSGIVKGKQIIIMGRGIGVIEGISGRLGNLPWGCRHQGRMWGYLKGPSLHLLTLTARQWSSRGGGDGGARTLPQPSFQMGEWWGGRLYRRILREAPIPPSSCPCQHTSWTSPYHVADHIWGCSPTYLDLTLLPPFTCACTPSVSVS